MPTRLTNFSRRPARHLQRELSMTNLRSARPATVARRHYAARAQAVEPRCSAPSRRRQRTKAARRAHSARGGERRTRRRANRHERFHYDVGAVAVRSAFAVSEEVALVCGFRESRRRARQGCRGDQQSSTAISGHAAARRCTQHRRGISQAGTRGGWPVVCRFGGFV